MIGQLRTAANSVASGAGATATTLATIRQRTDALDQPNQHGASTAATFAQAADKFTQSSRALAPRCATPASSPTPLVRLPAGPRQRRPPHGSSAAIGNVVNLIAQIARQTTLLALNSTHRGGAGGRCQGLRRGRRRGQGAGGRPSKRPRKSPEDRGAAARRGAVSVDAVHRITQAIEAIRPVFETVNGAVNEQNETTGEISGNAASASNFIASVGGGAIKPIGARPRRPRPMAKCRQGRPGRHLCCQEIAGGAAAAA